MEQEKREVGVVENIPMVIDHAPTNTKELGRHGDIMEDVIKVKVSETEIMLICHQTFIIDILSSIWIFWGATMYHRLFNMKYSCAHAHTHAPPL